MEVQFVCRIENLERCIKPFAPIAVKTAKFHLNQTLNDRFIVEIVGQREDDQEDLDTRFARA